MHNVHVDWIHQNNSLLCSKLVLIHVLFFNNLYEPRSDFETFVLIEMSNIKKLIKINLFYFIIDHFKTSFCSP